MSCKALYFAGLDTCIGLGIVVWLWMGHGDGRSVRSASVLLLIAQAAFRLAKACSSLREHGSGFGTSNAGPNHRDGRRRSGRS